MDAAINGDGFSGCKTITQRGLDEHFCDTCELRTDQNNNFLASRNRALNTKRPQKSPFLKHQRVNWYSRIPVAEFNLARVIDTRVCRVKKFTVCGCQQTAFVCKVCDRQSIFGCFQCSSLAPPEVIDFESKVCVLVIVFRVYQAHPMSGCEICRGPAKEY